MKKIGLALSGGSALGIAHIGVIQSFKDHGIAIDCISGTSAGSFIAACYAFDVPMDHVEKAAENLSWNKFSKFFRSAMGIATNEIVGDLLVKLIGYDANIEDAKIPLAIVATDISTGEKIVFRSGSVIEAVRASTAIPGLFTPIIKDGRFLVDGGLVENLPIKELTDLHADVKIGVNLARWRSYKTPKSIIGVMMNSVDIMVFHQSVAHGALADILIEPHLEPYTSSDWGKVGPLIKEGYHATTLAIPEIKRIAAESRIQRKKTANGKSKWYMRLWRWFTTSE
jgi:NTE family protein